MLERRLFLALAVFLTVHATPAALSAQAVTGRVTDATSGLPVGTGFVVLLDSNGIEVGRTLSAGDGRFLIDAPAAGRYRLRSERIGYRASDTDWFRLGASEMLERNLPVTAIPVRLASIEVLGETRCGTPERESGIGNLWEEIRKALAAASWSAENLPYRYRLHTFERDVDERRRRVFREDIDVEWGSFRTPYLSWAPDSLAEFGYVIQDADGAWYHAPDANTLLSRSFQQTHCFQLVRDDDEKTELIGLAFEPVPGREQIDIVGTLWVDETSSELHSIEYGYSGEFSRNRSVGGTIEFLRVLSGAWVVGHWEISVPVFVEPRHSRRSRRVSVGSMRGVRDGGGQVIEIEDLDGSSIYVSPDLVRLQGTVYDSIRGRALDNELVSIAGTGYQTLTEDDGSFDFTALLDGEYSLTSARIDSLGYADGRVRMQLVAGDTVTVSLAIPRLRRIRRAICPETDLGRTLHGPEPGARRILFGTVVDPDNGRPVPNERVIASWDEYDGPAEVPTQRNRQTSSDDSGRYVLCDLPENTTLRIRIRSDEVEIEPTEVRFVDDEVRVRQRGRWSSFVAPEHIWRIELHLRQKPDSPGE